jgi:RNA polymerase sigma-70 factor (ECF subfamily)
MNMLGGRTESIIREDIIHGYDKYYRLAYAYVHNAGDALDIVQEGAYKAMKNFSSLKSQKYATTWIYRIMINEALQFIKKRSMETASLEDTEITSYDNYDEFDLKKEIEKLNPVDKSIIVLRFFEDMKLKQIAQIMNMKEETVKTHLYRTIERLRISLKE